MKGRVLHGRLHSAALGVDKAYLVWLPGGYDASTQRYPVVYLLHGLGGEETNWVTHGRLAETADTLALQAIVVMPDGDDSFYIDRTAAPYADCLADKPPFNPGERPETYCVKQARYEEYIVRDLVAHVDSTFRTEPERKARGISGLSMGGFGALMLAMRHKDVFAAAASHSGLVTLLYAGPHPYAEGKVTLAKTPADWGREFKTPIREHLLHVFGSNLDAWRAYDPSALAAGLKDGELALYVDCGTEDGFKFQDDARYLHDVLVARGVTHEFALVPGEHTFTLWRERIRESLTFQAKHLAAPTP